MVVSKRMEPLIKGSSAIRMLFEEGKKMALEYGPENVYDFSLGNPSVPAPAIVNETIGRVVKESESLYIHGYMKNAGFDEVREAVAGYLNRRYGASYTMENIIMTVGAAGGINDILNIFLDFDDEVIAFAPFFTEYRNYVKMAGGNLAVVPADYETFQLNIDEFPMYVSEKTKLVIINNPNNPSGVLYSAETLDRLQTALEKAEEKAGHPIYVICDEPYRDLVYDGAEVPFMPDHIKNCLSVYSFSKSLSLPGERIGYTAISPKCDYISEVTAGITCSHRIGCVNAPSLLQLTIKECLETRPDLSVYDTNRKLLYNNLTALGFECLLPQGAFYLFVKSPVKAGKKAESSAKLVELGKKQHLLLVDGTGFGAPGYVRIAYCVDTAMIERSFAAFERLAAECAQLNG